MGPTSLGLSFLKREIEMNITVCSTVQEAWCGRDVLSGGSGRQHL